jgi:UDP-glucose 4-epimerase
VPSRYLVVGGAGFVGSHLVATVLDRGDDCTVIDNLSTGHRAAVLPGARFIRADLADMAGIEPVLADGPWDAVFHLAALSIVGDSMRYPYRYFQQNVGLGTALIEACVRNGVRRFVLSSTAALFGNPERMPIDETATVDPGSPYGESKWQLERVLHWADRIHGLRSGCLRYFNAAGADPAGRIGEDHNPETHLIPLVIDAALGRRPELTVFGGDYDTHDGTCIRDYVHVNDLADAHLRVLGRLDVGSAAYNVGTGAGHTVLEIVRAVERVGGRRVPHRVVDRRPGDPRALIADPTLLRTHTGWRPRFVDLDEIVRTAFAWREAHPSGFGLAPATAAAGG